MDSLGIRNNKRVLAASVFGDVSGFTAYIDRIASAFDILAERLFCSILPLVHFSARSLADSFSSSFE